LIVHQFRLATDSQVTSEFTLDSIFGICETHGVVECAPLSIRLCEFSCALGADLGTGLKLKQGLPGATIKSRISQSNLRSAFSTTGFAIWWASLVAGRNRDQMECAALARAVELAEGELTGNGVIA